MYEDLKLLNGDLTFDSLGRLVFIKNKEAIIQSIFNRLNTIKEELFYNLEYGFNRYEIRDKRLERNIIKIHSLLEDCLLMDTRISSVKIYDVEREDFDKFNLKIKVILTDGVILELSYNL